MAHMLDGLIGGVSYWATGWGLSYGRGTSSLVGGSNFFGYKMDFNLAPLWFFQFVFATKPAAIISGAITERTRLVSYFVYSIVITGEEAKRNSRN